MKYIKENFLKILLSLLFVFSLPLLEAQPPPPPGGSSGTGNGSGNSQGGNAPIGSGLFILLGMGAAYGGRKLYQIRKENLEE